LGAPTQLPVPTKVFVEHGLMVPPRNRTGEQARSDLGVTYELVELGNVATTDYLMTELETFERINGMINRLLRQFFIIKSFKSLAPPADALPPRVTKGA
jgi:hypothetical protein